jgi:hypothetical protein
MGNEATIIETDTGAEVQIVMDPISPNNHVGVMAITMNGVGMDKTPKTQYIAPPSFNLPSAIAQKAFTTPSKKETSDERSYPG